MTDRRGSVFVDLAPENRASPVPVPAPVSSSEIMGAHWTLGRQDMAGAELQSQIDGYGPIVTELLRREKPGLFGLNWYDPYTTQARQGMPYSTGRIWAKVQEIRKQEPGFMKDIPATNEAEFNAFIAKQETDRRHAAQDVAQRQQGIAQNTLGFGADVGTGFTDPINVGAMILTGGASAPVEGAVRSVGGTMARTMLKEAAVNAGTEVVELPIIAQNRQRFGEKMTPGEMVQDVATAGIGGALFPVVTHGIGAGAKAVGKAVADGPIGRAAAQATAPLALSGADLGRASDADIAHHFAQAVPAEIRTPDERAALHVIDRQADVAATNPFKPTPAGLDAHADRLDAAMTDVLSRGDPNGGAALPQSTPRRAVAMAPAAPDPDARTVFMQHVAHAENATGDPTLKNPNSSATGKYQFTRKTWLGTYKASVGAEGLTDAQIWAKRTDPALQEQLMQRLTADNAAHLHSIGMPETAGNLYLEHFAGQKGAENILKADPHAPIEGLLSKGAIEANPFLKGKTAGDVIDWAHRKMGGRAHDGPVLARENFDSNEEWADAQREVDMADAAEQAARSADAERTAEQGAGQGMEPAAESAIRTEEQPKGADLMPSDEPVRAAVDAAGPSHDSGAGGDELAGLPYLGHAEQMAVDAEERQATLIFDGGEMADKKYPMDTTAQRDFMIGFKAHVGDEMAAGRLTGSKHEKAGAKAAKALAQKYDAEMGAHEAARRALTPPREVAPAEVNALSPVEPAAVNPRSTQTELGHAERAAASSAHEDAPQPHSAPIEAERNASPFDKSTDKAPLAQTESIAHDLRVAAESEPDALFRVGDGETERPLSEILADLDAEDAAIAAVKACL